MAEEISEDDIPSSSSEAKMFCVTWPTEAERTEEMAIVKKENYQIATAITITSVQELDLPRVPNGCYCRNFRTCEEIRTTLLL